MVAKKSIVGQIENRNFLAPTGFKFQLNRTPKVTYFGNAVNIISTSNKYSFLNFDIFGNLYFFNFFS